jgi:hypothetical protein
MKKQAHIKHIAETISAGMVLSFQLIAFKLMLFTGCRVCGGT